MIPPDAQPLSATPLLAIRFESLVDDDKWLVRQWYHCPAAGDYVEVGDPEGLRITGTVRRVMWGDRFSVDDADVVVRVR